DELDLLGGGEAPGFRALGRGLELAPLPVDALQRAVGVEIEADKRLEVNLVDREIRHLDARKRESLRARFYHISPVRRLARREEVDAERAAGDDGQDERRAGGGMMIDGRHAVESLRVDIFIEGEAVLAERFSGEVGIGDRQVGAAAFV